MFTTLFFNLIPVDNKVQNKCISTMQKNWKRIFDDRIFNLQLQDFLETKMNAKEKRKSVKR
jgi:hypothetical protein